MLYAYNIHCWPSVWSCTGIRAHTLKYIHIWAASADSVHVDLNFPRNIPQRVWMRNGVMRCNYEAHWV